ncbi:hypothetical protein V6N13_131633 [Hibiscus sabdariffa]
MGRVSACYGSLKVVRISLWDGMFPCELHPIEQHLLSVVGCLRKAMSIPSFQLIVRTGLLGTRIARGAPLITHLFFADDSFIFDEVVNFEKSRTFFSPNVHHANRADFCRILGVSNTSNPKTYPDLPAIVGRNRKQAFSHLLDNSQWKV